jgi:hypothetical protein
MIDDPWAAIAVPDTNGTISAKRVDATHSQNFFWARDVEGNRLLVLEHSADHEASRKLPELRDIEIVRVPIPPRARLIWRLKKAEHAEVFLSLCTDIVNRCRDAEGEQESLDIAVGRTWRWLRLLKGGGSVLLSAYAQKGLIGELMVLERALLKALSTSDAITAWIGPEGAPKDFEVGRIAIESKARRGGAKPFVSITSAWQLDTDGVDELFLHVVDVDACAVEDERGETLNEIASRIGRLVGRSDPDAEEKYNARLLESGYDPADNYSAFFWIVGPSVCFQVREQFPRISGDNVTPGIDSVNYTVSLAACEPYAVPLEKVIERLVSQNGR